ncbi:DNA polymerase III subunit chi [Phaeovulum vinaykumarii]|uniref:DNA polymerase III, chi subunit n=1 Tax=Phaeovulum vinaykumarii TaxID=407234 RepID=A0A1N7K4F5_9RHOB|nr:DNA polymerase III subunit chi [Phaeovulum vinaykumarii]SIS56438.1 DNA polymerase III, chi subunit [Phaeovulum vinaykumarii]SOB92868.1 DNA polymerase III chi subunit [Phaeovulum vinaykumarii]
MGAVLFYHLTRSSAAATAGRLLPRALAAGWRVELRCPDAAARADLDSRLWQGPEEDFLPHGPAGGPHDARQPVLLTLPGEAAANAPRALMTVGGAAVDPAEAEALERVWVLFDGDDPQAVETARGQWRALTGAGLGAQYWNEDGGRWALRHESAPRE